MYSKLTDNDAVITRLDADKSRLFNLDATNELAMNINELAMNPPTLEI